MTNPNGKPRIAMVMAAGFGTRMQDLTKEIPKPLLPLGNVRIIDTVIHKLANQGIERVVVNLHYHADVVREHLGDGRKFGVELIYSEEPELLGSGGGIANAESYFEGETIVVVNADVLCEVNISELYKWHYEHDAIATMTMLPSTNSTDYGLLLRNAHFQLQGFLVRNAMMPFGLKTGIFTGHQVLSAHARSYLSAENQSIISAFYIPAIEGGERIFVYPYEGRWLDIGTKSFYLEFVGKIRSGEVNLNDFMK